MKLKNKKTGEIHEITQAVFLSDNMNKKFAIYSQSEGHNYAYRTLAELNSEWEDVLEEPKEYWYIDYGGGILCGESDNSSAEKMMISMGNHFESLEEAGLAVEKLKAWKRLKDNGVEFYGWRRNQTGTYELYMRWEDRIPRSYEVKNNLDLLFGGEE